MASPDLSVYRQLPTGEFMKKEDNSGPYVWDGSTMVLKDMEGDSGSGGISDELDKLTVNSASITSLQTQAVGANYSTFASAVCQAMEIQNLTGTEIIYRRGGAGSTFSIPDRTVRQIVGIANADQISIKRTDSSNTQVTVEAELFVLETP